MERLSNQLQQNRRVATGYKTCTANYRALWLIAASLLWLGCEGLQTRLVWRSANDLLVEPTEIVRLEVFKPLTYFCRSVLGLVIVCSVM